MIKVYISGHITDQATGKLLPNYKAKFERAERLLRACGYEPVNPCKLDNAHCVTWQDYMDVCLPALDGCQALMAMPCAGGSKGAKIEMQRAHTLGIPVIMQAVFERGSHAKAINQQ
jgi:hypothetical protein